MAQAINLTIGLVAALSALALCVPSFAQTLPVTSYRDPATGAMVTTMVLPPAPPTSDPNGRPLSAVPAQPAPSAGVTWIPGNYVWDAPQHRYVWIGGKYAEPPRSGARWIPGRWDLQPAGWLWLDGHWD